MSNEKHSRYFFNLTRLEETHVKDFAWAAVGQLTLVKNFHKAIGWVSGIQKDWNLTQECWEACMYVFWRLVSVFANPRQYIKYIEVGRGIMANPIRMYLPKEED